MTKAFIEKVIKNRFIDTKNYRYTITNDGTINRLSLDLLGTTGALDGWVVVKRLG